MHALADAILEGWERVKGRVLGDEAELKKRLARRRSKMFVACPRAWCLVVRASDQRIDRWYGFTPAEREDFLRLAEQRCELGHEVELTAKLVRWLVAPVGTDWPYCEKKELARRLGVDPRTLDRSLSRGKFEVRHIPLLGGRRGNPVPVVGCKQVLDPSSGSSWRMQHWIWWTGYRRLCECVPDYVGETLTRLPVYRAKGIRGKRGLVRGLAGFGGYMWVCPMCRRKVRKIYYPLPMFYGLQLLEEEFGEGHRDALPACPKRFGCAVCHRVKFFSMTGPGAWNEVIMQLSGGLLYGSEVEKPAWWKEEVEKGRRRTFVPHVMGGISKRREEVKRLVMEGLSREEMARAMGVSKSRVGHLLDQVYRQERVHSAEELVRNLKKMKWSGSREESARITGGSPVPQTVRATETQG